MRNPEKCTILILCCSFALPVFQRGLSAGPSNPYGGQTIQPGEKNPTPKDPRYIPPLLLPPSLRKNLKPGTISVFTQSGELDPSAIGKEQREQDAAKNRYYESNNESLMSKDAHQYLEKSLSRQFGTDGISTPHGKEVGYTETPARRFQIVFFTALPFTLALSYGAVRNSRGSSAFSGPLTAGFLAVGTSAAAGIAWYDQREWRKRLPVESSGANQIRDEGVAPGNFRYGGGGDVPIAGFALSMRF